MSVHATQREIEAARLIASQVRDLAGDDPEFIRDAIEGETSLLEATQALVASLKEDEAHAAGLASYIGELGRRKARLEKRAETKRALIAVALDVAERKKLETAVGTVSLVPVAPKVAISEEADIPAEFWKPSAPKLDRAALKAALKDGRSVPGASLSNGSITIRIS